MSQTSSVLSLSIPSVLCKFSPNWCLLACAEFDVNRRRSQMRCKQEAESDVVPWQERSSVSSLNPFLQLHSKLPIVFLQKWSQPPLWTSHSSISAGNKSTSWHTHTRTTLQNAQSWRAAALGHRGGAASLTFACLPIRLQGEAHGAAAAHACGCVLTGAVTPPIVHGAGFWKCNTKHECMWMTLVVRYFSRSDVRS